MSATVASAYETPQELLDLRATIRQIARERIAPRAGEIDRTGRYPHDIRRLLAENDIFALLFAERYGGTGTGTLMR
jgi:alkylation response protein AidB-like acyl-CoA dehydrogenase